MAKAQETTVVSARLERAERTWLQALADLEGISTAALIRQLLVPAVQTRLAEIVTETRES